ncbi:hypothetical protein [Planktothrix agardhii]|uniref:hypothetical protein n=1 Tax=Planktothrix agardhii TaxID=1160 RepID=UPI00287437A3|nr:hypothetical protein [Planktothrix agardhii]MDS1345664.1 hypothetical protein [Planktothrix agardhii NRERC-751]
MIKVTRTIKLKFAKLNRCKAQMFEQMTEENTQIANKLLSLPIKERRKMTTAKIMSELKSALVNQVIRHTTSPTGRKTKQYKVLPVEVNNQNWKLTQKGSTYSILNYGVFGAPPNSVKNNQKEYIQLSLFDWARYENPTPLA